MTTGQKIGYLGLGILAGALILRLFIESIWLLPSPVADSAYFLTASVNYCSSGFLGTTTFPIDPSGRARMIWHGFLSPMLFGAANPRCSSSGFYLILWAVKASSAAAIIVLARKRKFSILTLCGLVGFALTAQCLIAFRPETLSILLIALGELAIVFEQPLLLGAAMGALLCTQPTIAGLHGLVLLVARPALLRRWAPIGIGYAIAVLALLSLYPFPVADLINGILLQAKVIAGRTDGSLWWYYMVNPFLPAWSLLMLASLTLVVRRKPLMIVLVPVLWFFGPRLPATYYNLVPLCWLFILIASTWASPRVTDLLGVGTFVMATLGLVLLCARDILTIHQYGDTFTSTRTLVDQVTSGGEKLGEAPAFLALTNPALRITDPNAPPSAASLPPQKVLDLFAVNGRPSSPCEDRPPTSVSLSLGELTLFNSNSGWMVYVCPSRR